MSSNFGKSLQVYYLTVLVLFTSALGFGAHFYWKNGAANIEGVTAVFEATTQIDEIKNKNSLKEIKTLVESDRVRTSILKFDQLSKDVKELNNVEEVESYDSLKSSLVDARNSLQSLISFPELTNIFLVFSNKIGAFENYVVENNWKTLTRMSRRIKAQVSHGRVKSPGFFKVSALSNLVRRIKKDIHTMETVTENSVLSRADKNQIAIKLKLLMTEVEMVERYVDSLKSFYTNYTMLNDSYLKWIQEIEPEISYKKLAFEKNSEKVLFFIFAMIIFTLIAIGFGTIVYKRNNLSNKKKLEDKIIDSVKNGIVSIDSRFDGSFSQDFMCEFEKYREYVHKRMSFGSIFQDAMPFSSLLLDSNLNLVWANSLFYEHWNLEKNNKDNHVTWDYLQRFTNLGENDPVLSALNEGIAGIYNIQVKNDHDEEALPYEMYVSPVEYASQKRIMIFFYPLRSIEEALSNQSRSLVSPVSKTLDALTNGVFNSEFKEKVKKDFEIAGTVDVFDKFIKYNEFVNSQKNGLLDEIENLENTLYDQYKLLDDIDRACAEQVDLQKNTISHIKGTKENIVSMVELRNDIETLLKQTINTSQNLFQDEMTLLTHASDLNEIIDENKKAFNNVIKTKDEVKVLKNNIEQFKTKLMQMLDQLMTARKTESGQAKIDHALSKMKLEMQSFEKNLGAFSQMATSLDVGLSKMQIIMSKSDTPNLIGIKNKFSVARDHLEQDFYIANKHMRNAQMLDEEVIKSIKGLFNSFKQLREKHFETMDLRKQQNYEAEEFISEDVTSDHLKEDVHPNQAV